MPSRFQRTDAEAGVKGEVSRRPRSWLGALTLGFAVWAAVIAVGYAAASVYSIAGGAAILTLASFAASVGLLRSAMIRIGRRPALRAVGKRLAIVFLLVPNLLLLLTYLLPGPWWLELVGDGLVFLYHALPASRLGTLAYDLGVFSVVPEPPPWLWEVLSSLTLYGVASVLALWVAYAAAKRLANGSEDSAERLRNRRTL